jgi:tetratricopeptide (TPR) repeat protein
MKHLLTSCLFGSLLAAALPAAAQSNRGGATRTATTEHQTEDARSARAESLFREGQALLDAGHFDAACNKFEASETLENGLGTLLHLGDCYERAGRFASAWHTFLEAEAVAHAKKDFEREQVAAERVAALEPKLNRIVFVVPQTSRVPGLTVQLGTNAIPAAAWGTIIPVDAGVQQVTVFAKGYRPWHLFVDASRSDGRQYRVNVPTLEPASEPASDRRAAFLTAGVVTGSVGLAGIGAGAVFNALSHGSDDTSTCAKGAVSCVPNKSNRAGAYSDAATVSFALGGALVATGVTLFVLAPAPDANEQHALRIAARVASGGGRLQLEGAW